MGVEHAANEPGPAGSALRLLPQVAVDRAAVQVQSLRDTQDALPLLSQGMDLLPERQAAMIAGTPSGLLCWGTPCRLPWVRRRLGRRGGGGRSPNCRRHYDPLEAVAVALDHPLQHLAQVREQVEAVRHLNGGWGAVAHPPGKLEGTVAGKQLDPWVRFEP